MLSRIKTLVLYALLWLLFFEYSRAFFLSYNHIMTAELSWTTILQTFVAGFSHDVSLLGYIVEITLLVLIASLWIPRVWISRILNWLTIILLIVGTIITVVDAELYRNWGYRMDGSVLQYLTTPKEAMASTPLWQIALLLLLMCLTFIIFYFLYRKCIAPIIADFQTLSKKTTYVSVAIFVLCIGLTIIPIRGGFSVAALRTGTVYFSSQSFANHAAINDHWHFLYSFRYLKKEVANVFMEDSECEAICDSMLVSKHKKQEQLILQKRPNILLFILESFTADQISVLGGQEGVTPCLDSIAKEGVLFSNCYGNGTKSEMGIVSILSGYPAQPTTAIIKYTQKAEKLPYLTSIFDSLGYHLSLYHGGDLRFANLNSYFRNGGIQKCVTINDFDKKEGNTKWGAYDHVVFNRMFHDLHNEKEPFFTICYTLSSHEPFDVPMKSEFYGSDEYSKFLNSVHYSDSCIGNFITRAKQEEWWNNTIVIFVSDHGARISKESKVVSSVDKFHIPMIWTGGAVKQHVTIDSVFCQCDLPMMLCNQLQIPSKRFYFSKDILQGDNSFAFYAYNNGFGYIRGNQRFSWDNENGTIIDKTKNLQDSTLLQGKAFLQKVTTDFCRK